MSLEITNDARSERFRDLMARTFVELLGRELPYGPWTLTLRSDHETLSVVMTGPEKTRQEWAFDIAGAPEPAQIAAQFRRRLWKRRGSA
jgi:hypothetical protein